MSNTGSRFAKKIVSIFLFFVLIFWAVFLDDTPLTLYNKTDIKARNFPI
jgi:hypothetical protein